ncbi:MAG TPA: 30S ribosomal protein S20 [Candidatus Babeliales bacterium]|nr:30S ribosomal protein S20 [Candidatus Babeliales bacterium]
MANIKSSKKRAVQAVKRNIVNTARRSSIKTALKKVTIALEAQKDKQEVIALFNDAQAQLQRAKNKGLLHANTVARKISRLAKKVAAAYKA